MIEDDHLASGPHLFRGLVLDQMGRYDEAEASLDRAIYLDRACVLAHYHKGLLRQRNGDGPGAGRAFRNAIRVLEKLDQEKTYPEADGISSRDLADLARMQLEVMGNV
jgi:chemotaxis protein methyltransferase CheR